MQQGLEKGSLGKLRSVPTFQRKGKECGFLRRLTACKSSSHSSLPWPSPYTETRKTGPFHNGSMGCRDSESWDFPHFCQALIFALSNPGVQLNSVKPLIYDLCKEGRSIIGMGEGNSFSIEGVLFLEDGKHAWPRMANARLLRARPHTFLIFKHFFRKVILPTLENCG